MKFGKRETLVGGALCIAIAGVLSGCASHDLSDLKEYAAKVHKNKGDPIPPLPVIKPYERYLYQSADASLRDPFVSIFNMPKDIAKNIGKDAAAKNKYALEIATHNPEELESFELDSLRMVGTLINDADFWGIIKDSDGTVHRVKVGNYLGRNYGKITNIGEDRIEVREIVGDGQGNWDERQASIALSEK